jgi:hypothetical protein
MSHRKQLTGRRVGHKSTGGILLSIPEPVDPVANAAPLTSNTVARQVFRPCTIGGSISKESSIKLE